ncbi:unnamed protein product [Prorocentrum cordatum]|uniref:Uncharacterized protein n=1 Tax=Prorocentrum cordatum TaxID=2364126 RepID=A0ABN9SX60_9DINO|nr:unnamed protein product [Polarella glacialis]
MGAATAALSWLRPPATIVRGAPTPGSRRRRRTRLVAATTGGAVGQIRAAANRVGVGIAADGALAGCVRLHAHLRQGRLVAATTGGAVGQIRAAANRVGVGIAAHLAGARRRRRRRSRRRRRTRLVAATAGGQSDKSGQRPIGQGSGQSGWSGDRSRWSTCWMRSLARAHAPRPPCRSNHWRGSRTNQDSGQSGWSGDRSRWSTRWMRSPPERPSPPRGAAAPGPPRRSRPRQRRSPPLRGLRRSRPPARSTPACREP